MSVQAHVRARVRVGGCVGAEESRGLRLKEEGRDIEWESKREGWREIWSATGARWEEQYGGRWL